MADVIEFNNVKLETRQNDASFIFGIFIEYRLAMSRFEFYNEFKFF